MKFGIIGSGSWATALAKILTDNNCSINWLVRNEKIVDHISKRHHNPKYLSSVYFDTKLLSLTTNVADVVFKSDFIVVAVPSAYVLDTLQPL
jgi:glycerol-3-phosphate dehydrogenase (NAD(P)+)